MLVEAMFAPDRVLPEEEPVVAPQNHNGAAGGIQRLEGVEEAANLRDKIKTLRNKLVGRG